MLVASKDILQLIWSKTSLSLHKLGTQMARSSQQRSNDQPPSLKHCMIAYLGTNVSSFRDGCEVQGMRQSHTQFICGHCTAYTSIQLQQLRCWAAVLGATFRLFFITPILIAANLPMVWQCDGGRSSSRSHSPQAIATVLCAVDGDQCGAEG